MYKLVYGIVMVFFRVLAISPAFLQKGIVYLISFFLQHIVAYRKKVINKNLLLAFPKKSAEERTGIKKAFYLHMSKLMMENIILRFSSTKAGLKRIVVKNPGLMDEIEKSGQNIVLMSGHSGNWEYASYFNALSAHKNHIVYKKLNSKVFEIFYRKMRTRFGSEVIETKNTLRKVVSLNREKTNFILCMAGDQRPLLSETQYWTSFLGQETGVHLGSEKLAKKFNMAVVFVYLTRLSWNTYELEFSLITNTPKETPDYYITNKYFELLENRIQETPYNWLWSHNRWKTKRQEQ